jgi:DNA-directed RNA polymerase subunit RPC12/RpoP
MDGLKLAKNCCLLIKIFSDVTNYGYHAASRMHSTMFYQCKNCGDTDKAPMEVEEKSVLRCIQCGSIEFIKKLEDLLPNICVIFMAK